MFSSLACEYVQETALEYTDKKGNTPLHALVQAPEVLDDFYEKPTDDKKMCCIRLLDLALLPTDTNQNMETVFDLCPLDFRGILDGAYINPNS